MGIETIIGALVTLALAGITGIVWLVRLEGRINLTDSECRVLKEQFAGLESRILARLERIEDKLDKLADK